MNFIHSVNSNIKPGKAEMKCDDVIKSIDSVRFSSIFFEYNLSFSTYINGVRKKCVKSLNIVKHLCSTWWMRFGSGYFTSYMLYESKGIVYRNL